MALSKSYLIGYKNERRHYTFIEKNNKNNIADLIRQKKYFIYL